MRVAEAGRRRRAGQRRYPEGTQFRDAIATLSSQIVRKPCALLGVAPRGDRVQVLGEAGTDEGADRVALPSRPAQPLEFCDKSGDLR